MGIVGLDPSLFASGDTSAAYLIWQYMQGFANIVMIIILLAIVFSQLTGVGIDNYGIKKMLPKLIVMAILINFSFTLCQIAVDISNIVGSGAKDLFAGIGDSVIETLRANNVITATNVTKFGFSALFTVIFGGAALASVLLPVAIEGIMLGASFWWIPLIFVALIGLISIVIFFLLLAARKLLAVILVAISPLALVCYVLPNTRGLFKKWLDAFKLVLVVYPVCGALYGISKLMKVVAFSASGIHIGMMIVALLSTFVPFIVAPTLIKKSLNAVGEVGGFIGRMGERMKNGVRGANNLVKGSAMYKDAQRTAALSRFGRSNQRFDAAKRRIAELTEKQNSGATLSRSEQRELGRAQRRTNSLFRQRQYAMNAQSLDRGAAEDVETTRIMMREETGNYDTNIMGAQLKNLLDRVDAGETLSKGDQDKVYALTSQLASQSGGAKKIYEAINGRTGTSAQMMGGYMAINAKARQAAEGKSQRAASRISDIASGAISANTTQAQYDAMNNQYLTYRRQQVALGQAAVDETTWRANEAAAGRAVDETTVVQNIARNVLDKDKDFVTQSGAEVSELIKHISQERIDRMAANTNLFSYGDVAEGVGNTVLARASSTYVDSAGNDVQIRNIQKDNTGAVTGYERYDGTSWVTETGNLDSYTSKAEHARQQANAPRILGTRALTDNATGNVIRVRDMSDGTAVDIDTGATIDIRNYSSASTNGGAGSGTRVIGTRTLRHNTPDIVTGERKVIRVRDMDDGRTFDIDTGAEIDIRDYS